MNPTGIQMQALEARATEIRENARKASREMLEGLMAIFVDSIDAFQDRNDDDAEMVLWEMMLVAYARVS